MPYLRYCYEHHPHPATTGQGRALKVLTSSFHSRNCKSLTLSDRPGQHSGRGGTGITLTKYITGSDRLIHRAGADTEDKTNSLKLAGTGAPEDQTILTQDWVDAESGDRPPASNQANRAGRKRQRLKYSQPPPPCNAAIGSPLSQSPLLYPRAWPCTSGAHFLSLSQYHFTPTSTYHPSMLRRNNIDSSITR
ncbi:hypothetical protein E2C01_069518 [Portunus trituberculatus]|uniref:Uncharacterized protein n=1 Tax=Portunus trituberculatus TaxID=210409 RepID=A0A5B7HYR6_PORTR|nr:hypothetical protein [Portunus trituberculatus]